MLDDYNRILKSDTMESSKPSLIIMLTSVVTLLSVSGQSTFGNQNRTAEYIATKGRGASDELDNQQISVASFESDNRSLLEQLVAAVNDIRQRQRLHEQERQLGKLLELQQLEMLLRQQQSKYDRLESVQSGIVDELKEIHRIAQHIQGSYDALLSACYNGSNSAIDVKQQVRLEGQLAVAFNTSVNQVQTLESKLTDRLDRLQQNVSRDVAQLQQQHDNWLEYMKIQLQRLPEHSRVLVQQHYGRTTFFNHTWNEYKVGFGDVTGNYWIGNERLHELTKYGQYRLRVDLQLRSNMQWYWAEYSTFRVDNELAGYRLSIGGHSGTAGDSLAHVNGMKFSTRDRDNDVWSSNCAADASRGDGGGFWYRDCAYAFINSPSEGHYGFTWYHMGEAGNSDRNKLLVSRMKLLPIN